MWLCSYGAYCRYNSTAVVPLCRVQYPKLEVPLSISPPKRIGWSEGADQLLTRSVYHLSWPSTECDTTLMCGLGQREGWIDHELLSNHA